MILFTILLSTAAMAATEAKPPATVFASRTKLEELYESLSYPARISPKVNTVILAETDGVIDHIYVPLGREIKRGKTILAISHTDPIYKYAPMEVVSPVRGIVSAMDVTEGTQISKGQKLAAVTDPKQIRLLVEIPALDLNSLKRGETGVFQVSGRTEMIKVTIKGISPFVDPGTGTATAELEPEANQTLTPGLIGQVTFKANVHPGVTVPDHAIFYRGNDTFVRLVEDGKSKQIKVALGRRQKGYVEVLSGLAADKTLIERTSRYISDGEKVDVQENKPESK